MASLQEIALRTPSGAEVEERILSPIVRTIFQRGIRSLAVELELWEIRVRSFKPKPQITVSDFPRFEADAGIVEKTS